MNEEQYAKSVRRTTQLIVSLYLTLHVVAGLLCAHIWDLVNHPVNSGILQVILIPTLFVGVGAALGYALRLLQEYRAIGPDISMVTRTNVRIGDGRIGFLSAPVDSDLGRLLERIPKVGREPNPGPDEYW
jgi:hypothetical protein